MNKKLLLIGGGGHCKSVLDCILETGEFTDIGIIDVVENIGKQIMGIPIIGSDNDLEFFFNQGYRNAFVSLGSVGKSDHRIALFQVLKEIGFVLPKIIDKSALVSQYASVDEGVFIGKKCVVNAEARIKEGAIINTGAIIEHDCNIGSFAHIAPGVVLGGRVCVGDNTHIGLNSTIKQYTTIGRNTIIGMGSVVLKDVKSYTKAFGNPCVEVR